MNNFRFNKSWGTTLNLRFFFYNLTSMFLNSEMQQCLYCVVKDQWWNTANELSPWSVRQDSVLNVGQRSIIQWLHCVINASLIFHHNIWMSGEASSYKFSIWKLSPWILWPRYSSDNTDFCIITAGLVVVTRANKKLEKHLTKSLYIISKSKELINVKSIQPTKESHILLST